MAKNIHMTRERKIALPTILAAARAATRHVPMDDKQRADLDKALLAFREAPGDWPR